MMTVKEVARQMYAGKDCHDFEFDSLWNAYRNGYRDIPTVMQRWQRNARLKWFFTLAWLK